MNKRWFVGLSVLVVLSLLVSGCQSGPTAQEIVARLREVEASTEDAHAVLEISVQSQRTEEVVVEVWEKSPDKFRAEVLEASDPQFVGMVSVTDGHQGWMYNPNENEVVVGEAAQGEPTSPREILQFADDLIQRLRIFKVFGSGDIRRPVGHATVIADDFQTFEWFFYKFCGRNQQHFGGKEICEIPNFR